MKDFFGENGPWFIHFERLVKSFLPHIFLQASSVEPYRLQLERETAYVLISAWFKSIHFSIVDFSLLSY